jgi:hypothetical protein
VTSGTTRQIDGAAQWVAPALAVTAVIFALAAFGAHAWQAFNGVYVNHVSGIWLALARDLAEGVFYRDLISPLGYGGTRYFPLFFVIIGGLLKLGLSPLVAGWTASFVAAVVLSTGLARVGRALGAPRSMVWLLGAAAVAPYFVQQTVLEIRADVLSAGLNLWGLAAIISVWRDVEQRPRVAAAAVWFTLAFTAKITAIALPVCVLAALLLSGQKRAAWRLGLGLVSGFALFFLLVGAASAGRAFVSWRTCMFAGSSEGGLVTTLLRGDFLQLVTFSHLLIALFAVVAIVLGVAIVANPPRAAADQAGSRDWRAGPSLWMPIALFVGITGATGLALSSPGTLPSNQVIDWLQMTFVVLAWVAAADRRLTRLVSTAVALIVLWMGGQDLVRVRGLWQTRADQTSAAARDEVVRLVGTARTPALAESATWPVLAGHQAYLLDAFAIRVVMASHPDIARDLEQKIDARYFSSVIFQENPESPAGRGFFEHVHFGGTIVERILSQYRFDRRLSPELWIYVPKPQGVK